MSCGNRPGLRAADLARRAAALAIVLLVAVSARDAAAATRYDPALRFRSIVTSHFVVHYHQREAALARRLARLAEEVHRELTTRMGYRPRGRTHVVLVDQDDVAGGWATTIPYNLIEISATGPPPSAAIGHTTDWLRLVFTHEYAHVLHLEQSRGWARAAGAIFGRVPLAMPNLSLPIWQIEGLATFEESRGGQGRLHARDFSAIVRDAARVGRLEPLDRVGGGLVDWPGGHAPYAYGARFHAHLAERYGSERLQALSRSTAGRLPYFTAGAFKQVYGRSLTALWNEFKDAEEARAGAEEEEDTSTIRLTRLGYIVSGPRIEGDGSIVYSRSDPHGWPGIERLVQPAGRRQRLTTRVGGEQIGTTAAALYFDALELQRGVALSSDLYRLDRTTGRVHRLTEGGRLADPDVAPNGRQLVAVLMNAGRRDLVVLTGSQQVVTASAPTYELLDAADALTVRFLLTEQDPHADFSRPRWSPDGTRIAAESRAGGVSNIVVIDPRSGRRSIVAPAPGRSVTPAWTPDGRAILFASDREGKGFPLYQVHVDEAGAQVGDVERLTAPATVGHSPDVAPDGRSLVFVGYTTDGWDLFARRLDVDADAAGSPPQPRATADRADGAMPGSAPLASDDVEIGSRPYRPWSTLVPRAWLPVVEIDDHQWQIGATTGGADALGYHAWNVRASWPVGRGAEFAALSGGSRPDVLASYVYDRWRPAFYVQLADETTPLLADRGTAFERPFSLRDRSATTGVVLPLRRVRWMQTLSAAWRLEHRSVETPEAAVQQATGAARLGWGVFTARRFGYSVSPERGVTSGVSVEIARRALGGDFDASFARADLRGFVPALPRHGVVALRVSGAAAAGDRPGRRRARLGGASGDASVLSFAEDASSLLRGFPSDAFQGDRVALVNAEYRLPLAWPQRGVRHWPVFLRSVHATIFGDAGHAWDSGRFRTGDVKVSWGAELSGDVTLGYWLPITIAVGAGWGRDGADLFPDHRQVYLRLGHGF